VRPPRHSPLIKQCKYGCCKPYCAIVLGRGSKRFEPVFEFKRNCLIFKDLREGAKVPVKWRALEVRADPLQDQRAFKINTGLGAMMLGLTNIVFSEEIKTEAVHFGVISRKKFTAKFGPQRWGQHALKDGKLHPLAAADTRLGDAAKAALPGFIEGLNVIGDEDNHDLSPGMEGRKCL